MTLLATSSAAVIKYLTKFKERLVWGKHNGRSVREPVTWHLLLTFRVGGVV